MNWKTDVNVNKNEGQYIKTKKHVFMEIRLSDKMYNVLIDANTTLH